MPYNSHIHHRRSVRLKGYDYSQEGLYFVTICCQDKICRFGKIVDGEMVLNENGKIAYDEWIKLEERYLQAAFDVFQIMPNHIHGIIAINDVGATLAVAPLAVTQNGAIDDNIVFAERATARVAPTVGNIVGAYKSLVMTKCLELYKSKNEQMGKFWQRSYYEHIIRNEKACHHICDYILYNPIQWKDDNFYIEE
jgi:REP element-mobilizing transposase RayT